MAQPHMSYTLRAEMDALEGKRGPPTELFVQVGHPNRYVVVELNNAVAHDPLPPPHPHRALQIILLSMHPTSSLRARLRVHS